MELIKFNAEHYYVDNIIDCKKTNKIFVVYKDKDNKKIVQKTKINSIEIYFWEVNTVGKLGMLVLYRHEEAFGFTPDRRQLKRRRESNSENTDSDFNDDIDLSDF